MSADYGRRRQNDKWIPQLKEDVLQTPLVSSQKVYGDFSKRCMGCPYPRHGVSCRNADGSCLRTDMQKIELSQRKTKHVQLLTKPDDTG